MGYVIWANSRVDEIDLPSENEYTERLLQSEKPTKDKFSLLKDVKPDRFYNILGEVINLYDSGPLTVYLSDYTANTNFKLYEWGAGMENNDGREGDEYGYIQPKRRTAKDWPGPYGKMTIQLTLYDEHAHFVRGKVEEHAWVLLKNVQIKYGRNGGVLEGYMRGDENKMNVKIIASPDGTTGTPEDFENDVSTRDELEKYKEAVKRKSEWTKKFTKQQRDILDQEAGRATKRKSDGEEPLKKNSKQRREEKRAAALKKGAAVIAKEIQRLDLNENSMYAIILPAQVLTFDQFGVTTMINQSQA
jgi:protection of telomeres protein 1